MSGLRWTLWLSLLSAPCGYAISILLARISPEAIGEYGLLSVYVGITSVFLFLGGPAVTIRFIPALPADLRISFLLSYLMVACLAALPFQVIAAIWPETLRYVLGNIGSSRFQVFLMWLADLYILFNLAIAALKSFMELKLAQVLVRCVTVASFLAYASLCLGLPNVMAVHYHAVIWSIYFAFTAIATAVALWKVLALAPSTGLWRPTRLPDGFWRYTLGLQASSVLGFLSTKLDYVFILNAGGLATLGRYAALMTLLSIVPMFATFVLDSYLPSLVTLLASGDMNRVESLTRSYMRLICLLGSCAISFMGIFSNTLVRMFGSLYVGLVPVLKIALPFAGVQIANWIIGTVLSGVGRPQRDALAKALRTVLFVSVFWPLWKSMHFVGAVWAWGIAETGYQLLSVYLLRPAIQFRLSLYRAYIPMVTLSIILSCLNGWFIELGMAGACAVWFASMGLFLAAAKYDLSEIRTFWRALTPGSRAADSEIFTATENMAQAV